MQAASHCIAEVASSKYDDLFRKAEKVLRAALAGFRPLYASKHALEGGFVDPVSAIFWPFVEKIDSIRRTGNLLHDVGCAPYEKWAAESP